MSMYKRFDPAGFLTTVGAAVFTILIGVVGLVGGRNEVCAPFAALPGVSCPPVSESATTAAVLALVAGIGVAVALGVARFRVLRRWRDRMDDGGTHPVPAVTALCTFIQALALVAGITLFLILSARRTDGGPEGSVRAWPFQLTCGLLVVTAFIAVGWREGRLRNKAMRKWGIEFPGPRPERGGGWRSAPATGGQAFEPMPHPDRPADDRRWDGPADDRWYTPDRPEPPASTGIRDGWYGDGPQQGTRSLADEPGSIWGQGPQHGTGSLADEPGGFYSSDPFGKAPD